MQQHFTTDMEKQEESIWLRKKKKWDAHIEAERHDGTVLKVEEK